MTQVTIKVKKLTSNAVLPQMMRVGDAGFDLVSTSCRVDREHGFTEIHGTGLAFEIPQGYGMFIFPRSSCYKNNASMANCVAVIDSNYRGEVHILFKNPTCYEVGERIAQAVILPIPEVTYEEVDSLEESNRGANGLGSTGK